MIIIADIKINIMLVDDMVINRLILEDLILQAFNNSSKIPITHAANGEEALAILKDNYDYDLIFMDVNMPLINGYEASKFIKEKIDNDLSFFTKGGLVFILSKKDKDLQLRCKEYDFPKLKFMHELQNFYFAITGEDLLTVGGRS